MAMRPDDVPDSPHEHGQPHHGLTDDQIIAATRARIRTGEHLGVSPHVLPAEPAPGPCSVATVVSCETELGFPLPQLLRRLYIEAANGGVGPDLGLLGLDGGWEGDLGTAMDLYRLLTAPKSGTSWPPRLLPVFYLGDGEFDSVDCADASLPLLRCYQGDEPTLAERLIRSGRGFRDRVEGWIEATSTGVHRPTHPQ